jgi:flagellar biosynthesis protein FlhF
MIDVTDEPLALASDGRALLGLVGPAGVGKTTTAAKIAARARMAKKSVALVSCDSFRVGAMDQLGKYAHLMGARFHTATTRSELLAIVRSEDADVVIIDTSGRAVEPGSTEALLGASELRAAGGRKTGVLLCVPAALRAADATRVRRDFASSKPSALVVTKLDETDTPAGILHAWFAARLPVSACCTGQRVPEDLTPATPGLIGFSLVPDRKGAAK